VARKAVDWLGLAVRWVAVLVLVVVWLIVALFLRRRT
jgi:uncharacterized membrane protein